VRLDIHIMVELYVVESAEAGYCSIVDAQAAPPPWAQFYSSGQLLEVGEQVGRGPGAAVVVAIDLEGRRKQGVLLHHACTPVLGHPGQFLGLSTSNCT